jgi:predicted nuclease with TOPRIM domain
MTEADAKTLQAEIDRLVIMNGLLTERLRKANEEIDQLNKRNEFLVAKNDPELT